ncbi:hypothetical protein ACFFWC_04035, partial [Plantactinospora siamensis]
MAVRGWFGSVGTAAAVAAGTGAAQLGLGYGLGIIAWQPATDGPGQLAWQTGVAWAIWVAATATVCGAICAARLSGPDPDGPRAGGLAGGLWRLVLALSAALGGLLTVALVAVPARVATPTDTFTPQTIAAAYAVLGVLLGVLVAIWALTSPAVASNILGTVAWIWVLAIVAVADAVVAGDRSSGVQLGTWRITEDDRYWLRGYLYWPGAALSFASAVLIGAVAARRQAARPARRVGATVS